MNKMLQLCTIAAALAFGFSYGAIVSAAEPKPNIIFILADDLGYGDVGAYKKKPSKVPTPRLDQMAREGVRFTDAHSPSAVCSPTRYALLTGRYAWRTRLRAGVIRQWEGPLIAPDRLTVASMLREHGYATAMIGKWHLGLTWPTKDGRPPQSGENRLSNVDFTQPIGDAPTTRGFDYYYGVDVPNYPPYCMIENDRTVGIPTLPDTGREDGFNRPGPMLPGWRLVDILPRLTQSAVNYIDSAAREDKPFFLYFALTSPHYPVVPAPEFQGKTTVGDYGDFVHQTDWCVGQVLDALDRAGVADNTLVIFTSDNGPEITGEVNPGAYDRVQQYGHHSMDGLRGAKRDLWEGGHRVPFIARWPGMVPVGSVSDETICHVDFMATIAAICGAKLPDKAAEDSVNIMPALRGEELHKPLRPATVHQGSRGHLAIRRGDWVLIEAASGQENGARAGEPDWFKQQRGYVPHDQPAELFNLREDLIQKHNRYAERPEIVGELRGLLEQYIRDGRSTPGSPQSNDVPVPLRPAAPERRSKNTNK